MHLRVGVALDRIESRQRVAGRAKSRPLPPQPLGRGGRSPRPHVVFVDDFHADRFGGRDAVALLDGIVGSGDSQVGVVAQPVGDDRDTARASRPPTPGSYANRSRSPAKASGSSIALSAGRSVQAKLAIWWRAVHPAGGGQVPARCGQLAQELLEDVALVVQLGGKVGAAHRRTSFRRSSRNLVSAGALQTFSRSRHQPRSSSAVVVDPEARMTNVLPISPHQSRGPRRRRSTRARDAGRARSRARQGE